MKTFLSFLFLPYLLFADIVLLFPLKPSRESSFKIPIPPTFQEIWKTPNGKMVEYIPQNETLEAWNEIITVEVIPHQTGMLDFYLRKHKIAIDMLFSASEIFRSEVAFTEEKGTKVGYAHYRNPHYLVETQAVDNNFTESMGMKVVQGKNDLFRVAYNIKYPEDASPLPFEEKIQSFLESCEVISP